MKFTIKKIDFEIALNNLQSFLDKKDHQITSNVHFEINDEILNLKATDGEIGIETKIKISNVESDIKEITVNGREILKTIRVLRDENIQIEIEDKNLKISQGSFISKMQIFNPDEYPINEYPKNINENSEIKSLNIDSKNFIKNIKKIIPAIKIDNQKMSLNGALLEIRDYNFNFVSTDTKRLAIIREKIQTTETLYMIIHKRALSEIIKLFNNKPDTKIYKSESKLIIVSEETTFFTKIITEKFPEFERIIPKEFKISLNLPKTKLLEIINRIRSASEIIKLTFKKEKIEFESVVQNSSRKSKEELAFDTKLEEDFEICFNSNFIIDYINHTNTDVIEFLSNDPNKPFLLKSDNFQTIILPVI
ncbi:MAG: DNA polymerase III subunit beta [Helicobacter sp.]|nr:DNA polymerase III subunit beta [Helicobacter sp.]